MTEKSNAVKYGWQNAAIRKLIDHYNQGGSDFLICAGVGSGKTRAALNAAKETGATRIVVYTNTAALVQQWTVEAKRLGIDLKGMDGNAELANPLPRDVMGFATTFGSLGSWDAAHEIKCSEHEKTVVIIDEGHHLSDESGEWGEAAKRALSAARFRIHLTGTPLRTDGTRIPFLEYKETVNGLELERGDAAFFYSYGEAVANGTCSRVGFIPFDGESKWAKSGEDVVFSARLSDDIATHHESARKRAALEDPREPGEQNLLVKKLLAKAHQKVRDLRTEQENAAGVVACMNVSHAYEVASMLEQITGEKPIVVTSEDAEASAKISAFRDGVSSWIVSVRMVTEGVDIPRLRVAAYLSDVSTELFWWQFMGRIVRSGRPAYFFMPALPELVAWSRSVEEEMNLAIEEKRKRDVQQGEREVGSTFSPFESVGADGDEAENIVAGDEYPPGLSDEARRMVTRFGLRDENVFGVMAMINELRGGASEPTPATEMEPETYDQKSKRLREGIHRRVGQLHRITGMEHGEINKRLNRIVNIRNRSEASIAQLEKILHVITEDITRAKNGH